MTIEKVIFPKTVDEILDALDSNKHARLIAGGTDILVDLKNKRMNPEVLINCFDVGDLRKIEEDGDYLVLGPSVTFTDIAENSIFEGNLIGLKKACASVGSPQIRNRGTIGGNLANRSTAADSVPTMIALGAKVKIESKDSEREVMMEDYFSQACKENELITEFRFKKLNDNQYITFSKYSLRKALAISRLTLAVFTEFDSDGKVSDMRVASGAIGRSSLREKTVEKICIGNKINEELIDEAITSMQKDMDIRLTGRSSLPTKRSAVAKILRDCLVDAEKMRKEED